jgi:hypothetical protein
VGVKEGRKVKGRLSKYTVRNHANNVERYAVHWPINCEIVSPSFLVGLFFEPLKAAESLEQFKAIFLFENFAYPQSLREAYRICKAITEEQQVRMFKTGTMPTIS